MNNSSFTRRHFLRAAGVTLGLPVLEYFQPRGAAAADLRAADPRTDKSVRYNSKVDT